MSASFYLITHLIALVLLVSGLSIVLYNDTKSRFGNILLGVSSVLVFIAGFGLIAKLGYSISSVWIIGKLLIWLVVAGGAPMIAKRYPSAKQKAYFIFLGLISLAVFLAVAKPN